MSLVPLGEGATVVAGPAVAMVHARPDGGEATPALRNGLPLAGIRVVEATSRIQGPFAGMLLRLLGAGVVRVQPPEGDYGRAAVTLHRGKDAVQLDLGAPAGRQMLIDLVDGADVFLHNWRPGKAAEWGLQFDDLARRRPGLVYAQATGWGDLPGTGHLLGTDFLVQARTGLGHGLRPEDEPPFPSRVILCDLFGALVTAEGVLAALYRRQRDGGSYEVGSSLAAGALSLLDGYAGRPRWGILEQPLATAAGLLSVTVDGDDDLRRAGAVCCVDPPGIAARLGEDTAERWEDVLNEAGVAAAVVGQDLAAVAADPRLVDLFEPVAGGGLAPRSPWTFA
jgi:CoA:oxalate CoA-transferase